MENGFRSKQDSAANIRVEISFDLIMPSWWLKKNFATVKIQQDLLAVVVNIDEDLINGIHSGYKHKS